MAVSPDERDRSFRENEIDGAVLPRLTHENLKELGVIPIAVPDVRGGNVAARGWRPR